MFNLAPVAVPDLTGRSIFVSGAGKGIGAEVVRLMDQAGAKVFAGVHGADTAEPLPPGVVTVALDVTRPADVEAAHDVVTRNGGRLDALINNAGTISTIAPLATLPASALTQAFEVNVVGAHRLTLALLPLLKASKGKIVNAGTGAATTPMEGWTAYCASKAGLQMLTRMMALELAPDHIRAFFLGIPPTDTAMQDRIRVSGLNAISQIPKEKLVPIAVPASCLAWLCGPGSDGLDDPLLDIRREPFTSLMEV
jgi:NAD(P)-dependent dehydrogenase (short-subunit alcohol dehydrogenase family)